MGGYRRYSPDGARCGHLIRARRRSIHAQRRLRSTSGQGEALMPENGDRHHAGMPRDDAALRRRRRNSGGEPLFRRFVRPLLERAIGSLPVGWRHRARRSQMASIRASNQLGGLNGATAQVCAACSWPASLTLWELGWAIGQGLPPSGSRSASLSLSLLGVARRGAVGHRQASDIADRPFRYAPVLVKGKRRQ
jgi:hypothetical protein